MGINFRVNDKKRSLENFVDKMGNFFGSQGIFLKTGKMGRREKAPYKFGMGPRWLNPALIVIIVVVVVITR